MKKLLLALLALGTSPWSNVALSATDFVAVRIEAENFSAKSDGWTLTDDNNIPDIQPDPDPPHNSTASGRANMELLPDLRVNHSDDIINGVNFWGNPGPGPYLEYRFNVPEAGRYLVYTKAYSTGTEDNGLHVGINNTTPASGARIQLCSKQGWFWTSGQRTNENHCGVAKSIYVDVVTAGTNLIKFYAREDGFEIDQFMLLKETHDGSLDCFPMWNDKVRCKNIATGAVVGDYTVPFSSVVDGELANPVPVDLDVELSVSATNATVGETIIFTTEVANQDYTYTATNAKLVFNLPAGVEFIASADCAANGTNVECMFTQLTAGQSVTAQFDAQITADGTHTVTGTVTADQSDNVTSNNTSSATVTASAQVPAIDGAISLSASTNAVASGDRIELTARLGNVGTETITSAEIVLPAVAGSDYDELPAACNDTTPVTCQLASIPPGQSATIVYYAITNTSGVVAFTASLAIEDDEVAANNYSSTSVSIIESPVFTGTNGQLVIEAEQFFSNTPAATSYGPDWFIVDNQWIPFPADPDNASPAQASEEGYVELLPDSRVDSSQAEITGVSNFESGGTGATLSYQAAFFEAGDYYVFARVRANNDQDSVLHIGLENDWQSTAEKITVCNPDGNWQWTNSIMINNSCNSANRAVINVAVAGVHQLMVSQGTDGLELDKLVLTKDSTFLPENIGPSVSVLDNPTADIQVSTELSASSIKTDEATELLVMLKNQSATQDSIGISVAFEGISLENVSLKSGFDSCRDDAIGLVCTVGTVAAQQQITGTLEVTSDTAQTLSINSTVKSDFADDNPANNSASAELSILESGGGSVDLAMMLCILLLLTAANYRARRNSPLASHI